MEATAKRCRAVPGLLSLLGKNALYGTVRLSEFLEAPIAEAEQSRSTGAGQRVEPGGVQWEDVVMIT